MWGAGFLRGLIHLIDEGLAVGTLDLGRVGFMGTHLNLVQSTVILCLVCHNWFTVMKITTRYSVIPHRGTI